MDPDKKEEVTPEELAEEQAGLNLPKEEEVREEIISEFGFDEEADKEKIEKAVKREMAQRTITSKAIQAKIKHRTTAEELRTKLPPDQKPPQQKKEEKKDDLSSTDLYALMNAQVPEEDVEEVVKAAKVLGKSIKDALKDDMVKAILAKRVEHRKTADANNVRPVRPGTKTKTDAEILAEAGSGKIPEKGSKEAEDLFWARRGGKRK